MGVKLYKHQEDALSRMKNGCILCGGVGSGKSRTGIAYYYIHEGGSVGSRFAPMQNPRDLIIITTARKRDTKEWEGELSPFLLSSEKQTFYTNRVVIDSWNNIKKYVDEKNCFFIFDEQRVVGRGVWVKSFLRITKNNDWILLSATPGDTWMDYIPVFIANGFYKNFSEFKRDHVVYKPYMKYPVVDRYLNTGRLIRLRNSILVNMDFIRPTVPHSEEVYTAYDILLYKQVMKTRIDPYKNEPITNASGLCYVLRKIVNSDPSRIEVVRSIVKDKRRGIIFYNYDYELELLKNVDYGPGVEIAEWNGHKHQPIPETDKWVYLVQYNAGAEGWNCIKTDTIIFYSQNYSYKTMVQASGRIDRLNTPFTDLYYYRLKSRSSIDLAISRALAGKKKFNEQRFFFKV